MKTRIAGVVLGVVLVASAAWAQDWKGNGRMGGKVVDEQGKPLEGVTVTATLPTITGAVVEATTDKRGEWSIEGVVDGSWQLVFEKDKFNPGKGNAEVDEAGGVVPVRTTLKKAFDPNAFIKAEAKKADALMSQKKFAEARAVYQGIVAKVPEIAGPMQLNLAQTYYAEGNFDKAIECLKTGLATVPTDAQAKMLLADALAKNGALDEASQVLSSIDEATITDAHIYLNFAVAFVNAKKPEGAVPYLDKAVSKFPQTPLVYFYRATTEIEIVNKITDPKDPKRQELLAKIKADLEKFLKLSPSGPDADQVRKILEQISK